MSVLFLHHRYRTLGGEENAVKDLMWLVREHLGEPVHLLERDSAQMRSRTAGSGLLRGGLEPEDVTAAVESSGADVVHAHNLHPTFGWRALAAAKSAGAHTVLHLHNYRLVCAVGTCVDPGGADCVRCHGRSTVPGLRLNCRGGRTEAALYAAGLALQQRKLLDSADALVVPSEAAKARLRLLGIDIARAHVVPHVVPHVATEPSPAGVGVLIASRLSREKGVDTAIAACAMAGLPLTVAGDGPWSANLRRLAGDGVVFVGRVPGERLGELRRSAAVEAVPSRAHETFGLSAVEAMAAGVPVVASRVGALAELADAALLVSAGDPEGLAEALRAAANDAEQAKRGLALVARVFAPSAVAPRLAEVYAYVRRRNL